MNPAFWKNRSVFLTGHTGFKGGWTVLLLSQMGAKVYGYSLEPPTKPSFFTETKLETCCRFPLKNGIHVYPAKKT